MFKFVKKLFSKMGSSLGSKIQALFSKGVDASTYTHLEELLYEADLGPSIASDLVEKLQIYLKKNPVEKALPFLKDELAKFFTPALPSKMHSPQVILVVGVNGSGKTTSIAKLSLHYKKMGKKVLIAAGDTFRAAAVEQLQSWADKIDVSLVKSSQGGDSSAVAFDALKAAIARGMDVVLIDTAGRLQNKEDLMQELAKIRRVLQKQIPESPHETLLVLDATTGQNAIDQATIFHKFCPITGIVLTKLDSSAKGGVAIPIQKMLGIPIVWVGLGEGEEDLIPFDQTSYLDALLAP